MLQIAISFVAVFIVTLLFNFFLKTHKKEDGSIHAIKTVVFSLVYSVIFSGAFLLVHFLFFNN